VALQAIPKVSLDNIKAEMDAEKVARDAVYKVVPRDCCTLAFTHART